LPTALSGVDDGGDHASHERTLAIGPFDGGHYAIDADRGAYRVYLGRFF
jgi:hypothetical protein